MRLTSAGAAGTVTGSCHLLEVADRRILVDCGLFQGRRLEDLNREPFPFDPATVDHVLLTHGHLDHVGRLPLLARRGYAGPIHAIRSTRAIAEVILLDSGEIQVEEYDRALRRAREDGRADDVPPPLYAPGDVHNALAMFREIPFDEPIDLGAGVRATIRPAGHILGSGWIEVDSPEGRIVFSGDLGNRESLLHEDAVRPSECDAVVVETTYADRDHRPMEATLAEFRDVLVEAVEDDGIVLIPSFALERAQAVLYAIGRLVAEEAIPALPVYLDSPMAARMTRLYAECANEFRAPVAEAIARGEDPFEPPGLEYTVSPEESRRINDLDGSAIVIAGSGMMNGGRIGHHLIHHMGRPTTSLVVVGYQAEGTTGREIVDGAKSVRIYGRTVDIRGSVHTINGLSAHADRDDLLAWLEPTGDAAVFLVHGEPPVIGAFAGTLAERGRRAIAVERDRPYPIG